MEAIEYLGLDVEEVLIQKRVEDQELDYRKVEGYDFLEFRDKGFFLASAAGVGFITSCKIYFFAEDGYLPASDSIRGRYSEIRSYGDMDNLFGHYVKEFRGLKIPSRPPILPSRAYEDGPYLVSATAKNDTEITSISIKFKERDG